MFVVSGHRLAERLDRLRTLMIRIRTVAFGLLGVAGAVAMMGRITPIGLAVVGTAVLALAPMAMRHHPRFFGAVMTLDSLLLFAWAVLLPPTVIVPAAAVYLVTVGTLLIERRVMLVPVGAALGGVVANLFIDAISWLRVDEAVVPGAIGATTGLSMELVIAVITFLGTGAVLVGVGYFFSSVRDAALAEHERLEQLLENAPGEVAIIRDGAFVYLNSNARRRLGLTESDVEGQPASKFVPVEEQEALTDQLERLERGEIVLVDAIRVRTVDGERIYRYMGMPVLYRGSMAALTFGEDITEMVEADERSRAREKDLTVFFDRVPVPLYRTTPGGAVVEANKALERLLGYTRSEMISDPKVVDQIHADSRVRDEWRRQFPGDDVILGFEEELIRKDGERIWVEDSGTIVRDEDGEILYYEGALIDITSRREAEIARARLLAVLDSAADSILVYDRDGRCLYANHAARAFFGGPQAPDLDGFKAEEAITDPDVYEHIQVALREQGVWTGDYVMRRYDGTAVPASLVVQAHHVDPSGPPIISVIGRDITELKSTQAKLEELVKAKDEFVASVSHEIRTPLTAAIGFAEELSSGLGDFDTDTARELARLVAQQAIEVSNIVEDLLVVARAEAGTIPIRSEPVSLADEIDAVLKSLVAFGAEDVLVTTKPLTVNADSQRVRQVVRNLVTNATRYGGDRIEVRVHRVGDRAVVEVCDDGDPIPEDQRDRMFEPYERTHSAGLNTASVGLGLAVSRQLAELMGGDLTYRHQDGWSVFRLSLPVPS